MSATIHSSTELESIRRSAAMAPLPTRQIAELLDGYVAVLREREQVRRLLAELGPNWRGARVVLNQLSELMTPAGPTASDGPAAERPAGG